MHSSTHTHARDAGSGWTETATRAKAKKRGKKTAAKKSAAKKTAAKKTAAKKTASKAGEKLESPTVVALRREVAEQQREVPALRRELGTLKRKVADLNHKLAELATAIAGLTSRPSLDSFAGEDVVEDPFLRWLGHPSIEQYRGRHVAIHATRGVVADADSLREVLASVRAQGISRDDVCLATVPAGPF